MKTTLLLRLLCFWTVALACLAGLAMAQDITIQGDGNVVNVGRLSGAGNVIVPQARSVVVNEGAERIGIGFVRADVDVTQQVAVTTLDIGLVNSSGRVQEAVLMVPVPDGAIVRGFDFEGQAAEPTAQLLPALEARATYDEIVARSKDPALLEFAGYGAVRSSVFPVPAGGQQKVRLVYEHILPADGDRVDFLLPRSESLLSSWIPWTLEARVRSNAPISTVYSPSHAVELERVGPREVVLRLDGEAAREPGPFQFSYLLQGHGMSASLYAYPDARVGGGYFLLLAGLPVAFDEETRESIRREVTLVIDTSGSMRGEKLEQAVEAARQVLAGLEEGEGFNIVDYHTQVSRFAPGPVLKTDASYADALAYLDLLKADGGTNIDGALRVALTQDALEGMLPLVLFLTDGLPTAGEKSEVAIRENAQKFNEAERRIFTFGVGHDVNVPLLDRLADASRATSTYVQPGENVEEKVSQVYRRLVGPVLSDPRLTVLETDGGPADHRVREVLPQVLGDLYEGDQVVVLGKYRGEDPLRFEFAGDYFGEERSFRFDFRTDRPGLGNSFVPRLWASRRIAELIDEIRQAGADPAVLTATSGGAPDPAMAELATEILALSTEFGILTEYTAFLALEGTDLRQEENVLAKLNLNLLNRAQRVRIGRAALNQSTNTRALLSQRTLNRLNRHYDQDMNEVQIARVRQVGDRAFFKRDGYWVDSRLVARAEQEKPDEVVGPGSPRYRPLISRLIENGQQGVLSMGGDVVVELEGRAVLIRTHLGKPPAAAAAAAGDSQGQG